MSTESGSRWQLNVDQGSETKYENKNEDITETVPIANDTICLQDLKGKCHDICEPYFYA